MCGMVETGKRMDEGDSRRGALPYVFRRNEQPNEEIGSTCQWDVRQSTSYIL